MPVADISFYALSRALSPEFIEEWFPSLHESALIEKPLGKPVHAGAKLIHRHVQGHVIHVEQCAEVPAAWGKDSALAQETRIEWCAGEGSEHRDLNIVE